MNFSWIDVSSSSTEPSSLPSASIASLCRMPANRSRSVSDARTAAAAGLFSSWVSPAVSLPSASSRSRWAISSSELRMPVNMPCSRWTAIGYHCWNFAANSGAGSARNRHSVTARTVPAYCWSIWSPR
jgi:hypothetical protein